MKIVFWQKIGLLLLVVIGLSLSYIFLIPRKSSAVIKEFIEGEIREGTKICSREIDLGRHIYRTNLHLKFFLPLLVNAEKIANLVVINGEKISNLSQNCLKDNCGAQCSCNEVPVTKYVACADITIECECKKSCTIRGGDTICITRCTGGIGQATVQTDVACRDAGKVVTKTDTITARESCDGTTGSYTKTVRKCLDSPKGVPECGTECCTQSGTKYNPPDISNGGIQQLNCQQVDECKPNPNQCLGQGEGPSGTAPCPEGISQAFQEIETSISNYEDVVKELETYKPSLDELEREKKELARKLRTWFSQREKKDLIDCIEFRESGLSKSPVLCLYGGLSYYECER